MPLVIAIYTGNRAMGGVETDWTEVDRALTAVAEPLPLLRSITVHGTRVLTRDDALDLRAECDRVIPQASTAARWTLTRLKELTEAALSLPDSELRLIGSG
ncbi:MAG: hypothetical protein ABIW80_15240 [Lapillicoccus sp.]